jgi:hypothetical protein
MWEQFKWYLIEIAIKKYTPVGIMAAMAAFGTFMAAHTGAFEQWGVNYIPEWSLDWLKTHPISGSILLIELDTTSTAILAAVVGLVAIVGRAGQQHTTGTPTLAGGMRAGDPPKV